MVVSSAHSGSGIERPLDPWIKLLLSFDVRTDLLACLRVTFPFMFQTLCEFAGRPVGAFVAGEPGRFLRGSVPVLRCRHTHALPCWKGNSYTTKKNNSHLWCVAPKGSKSAVIFRGTEISGTMRSARKNPTSTTWQSTAHSRLRKEWVRNKNTYSNFEKCFLEVRWPFLHL